MGCKLFMLHFRKMKHYIMQAVSSYRIQCSLFSSLNSVNFRRVLIIFFYIEGGVGLLLPLGSMNWLMILIL